MDSDAHAGPVDGGRKRGQLRIYLGAAPGVGKTFAELDLDALLARAPEVAVVDELAHTNAPGSRDAKRWQDVEELLAAGIDVLSTVNVHA